MTPKISDSRPQFGRRTTFQRGTIYTPDKLPVPCAVRDVSAAGAQLFLASSADLPATFRLLIDGSGAGRMCTILERSGDRIDVVFT